MPLGDEYVRELNEAYNHFFFHYTGTPLLVVETSQFDLSWGEEALADLERQIRKMGKGTRYYVPRDLTPARRRVEPAVSSAVAPLNSTPRWYMLQ